MTRADLGLNGTSKALVVVAHPDDETIWMGGVILNCPEVRWTVVSLCRGDDADREPRFLRVARRLGARGIILDMEDEGIMNIRESVPEARWRILRSAGAERFTHIFTHGYNGEYGHPRHRSAHRAVKEMVRTGALKTRHLFYFGYEMPDGARVPRPRKNASVCIKLPAHVYAEKRQIVCELYGFGKKSFEYEACLKREAFFWGGKNQSTELS